MAGSVDDVVRFSDDALYHAKGGGRNQTVCYSVEAIRELSYQDALNGRVRDAAQAMNAAVAAKDGPAREHAEGVARVAGYIAARLGWGVGRRTRLREAALLHDVGKLAVPDSVLRKHGRLTAAEQALIRSHSTLGARIVEGLLDDEQRSWVRAHHERLDGRGYPDGLAGGRVPDGARILAVAEAYDAMTRPGFAARLRSPAEAIAELQRGAASEFDAAAVAALSAWTSERTQSRAGPVA
jgi:putative nucleotidyltransferase with HDIG domain